MRDRLIELVKKHVSGSGCLLENSSCAEKICRDCKAERFADYLIANGVILPPCKVGDIVYTIDGRDLTITNIFIAIDRYEGIDYKFDCQHKRNNGLYPYYFSHYDIGKTVFLTKEEAEKALAKENNNAE